MSYTHPHVTAHGTAMGWRKDLPDFRDRTPRIDSVAQILSKNRNMPRGKAVAPATVDLRALFSAVEDQGNLGSCTANAGVALFEYFQKNAHGEYLDGSRLFLYKATRELNGESGDTGAELRTTMKAMALFGVPPEKAWPYVIKDFDDEPPAFCYAYGQNFKAMQYYRLDPPGQTRADTLKAIKNSLAAKLPAMFGFSVYSSIPGLGAGTGDIPFPSPGEKLEGGHAIVAAGYDDARKIGKEKGALLIRNSWSTHWGEAGYGWLPYRYVLEGLADDFWTLVRAEFVGSKLFE